MKRRIIERASEEIEDSKADNFINDIAAVYKKHGLSLTHEDYEGSFIIDKLSEANIEWLQEAYVSGNIL